MTAIMVFLLGWVAVLLYGAREAAEYGDWDWLGFGITVCQIISVMLICGVIFQRFLA